jgi:hypothetical protein
VGLGEVDVPAVRTPITLRPTPQTAKLRLKADTEPVEGISRRQHVLRNRAKTAPAPTFGAAARFLSQDHAVARGDAEPASLCCSRAV